ncbi:hypothetical protein ACOSQ3_012883 [Xanthoceras sorbifolium]
MSSPDKDLIIREIKNYAGSPTLSEELTDNEPQPLSIVTVAGFLKKRDPGEQLEIWGMESGKTKVVDKVRGTNLVIDVVLSTLRPFLLLPSNPTLRLDESDLQRIIFQYGIPKSVALRPPASFERSD